jgi:hypothetical protein
MSKKRYRYPLMLLALIILTAAAWAGLLRLGWSWPVLQPTLPVSHGPLMVAGFFGTLIALERAVAMGKAWAYGSPLLSGIGGLLVAFGLGEQVGPVLMTLGSAWLVLIFAAILRQHRDRYMVVMALGALALLVGNLLWLFGTPVFQLVLWWSGFLILTIAGERLELGRLVRQTKFSQVAFAIATLIFLAGLVILILRWDGGVRLTGVGMILLGLWLLRFDIARRTVKQTGLTRFIAVCLLSGYVWLLVSGIIALFYGAMSAGPVYDAMLHSIFLGFVFAMIFGHAPIIFPAVLGIEIHYKSNFYFPLILLHVSLVVRIGGELLGSSPARLWGGLFNVIAVIVYLGMLAQISSLRKSKVE